MSKNKKDQANTKALLSKAFEHYLINPVASLDSLTIGRFSKLANIHRVTFYHHFLSMNDFIKWYLHKDLIFQMNASDLLTIEASLKTIFDFINHKRPILDKIMNSRYGPASQSFISEEALTYQLTNMQRIDIRQVLLPVERRIYARFYAQAIQRLIVDYIMDAVIQTLSVDEYLTYATRLIKNYIEKLIDEKEKLT
jgi:hypothetical protein